VADFIYILEMRELKAIRGIPTAGILDGAEVDDR
jgi:hypothetical protein